MRSDWSKEGKTLTSILDLDHQKMIVIDHAKKKSETYDLAQLAAQLKSIPDAQMTVELKPTGKTRSLLGRTCQEYQIHIVAPYKAATGESVDTLFDGPAWIAQDSPGQSDYRAFYRRGCIGWISRRSSQ